MEAVSKSRAAQQEAEMASRGLAARERQLLVANSTLHNLEGSLKVCLFPPAP